MKKLLFVSVIGCSSLFYSSKTYGANICYFSLNNLKEFKQMEKFTKNINKFSKNKITVKEFVMTGDNAEDAFLKMVNSGEKCDGLVISGHHTGSFGGKNASSNLSIDFMEKLSCNADHKEFFSHIKALWLQGCRTLGVSSIAANEGADFHTERVGAVLTEDHLTQSFADLNLEFSATLDQDNPLSSRYLRIFPRATTFGWTKTAPGENAHSEYSIPFHIANIATLNDDRGKYFDNPVKDNITAESALKYVNAINQLLAVDLSGSKIKCDRDEKTMVNAWLKQGRIKESKYAFDNSDLNAFESLYKTNNPELINAGKLSCDLLYCDDSSLVSNVENVLKSESLIAYSFNTLHEVILRLKNDGKEELLKKVQEKLKKSKLVQDFVSKKIASPDLGVLRKIDYYSFWSNLTGNKNPEVERSLDSSLVKFLRMPQGEVGSEGYYDRRDFIRTFMASMFKHNLFTENTIDEILKYPESREIGIMFFFQEYEKNTGKIPNIGRILKKIMSIEAADENLFKQVLRFSLNNNVSSEDRKTIFLNIARSSEAHVETFINIVQNLNLSKTVNTQILEEILISKNVNRDVLMLLIKKASNDKYKFSDIDSFYKKIINSKNADVGTLSSLVLELEESYAYPRASKEKLYQEILSHKLCNEELKIQLAEVAMDTGYTDILSQIIKSDNKNINFILIKNIEKNNFTSPIQEKALQQIALSNSTDLFLLKYIQTMLEGTNKKNFGNETSNLKEIKDLVQKQLATQEK